MLAKPPIPFLWMPRWKTPRTTCYLRSIRTYTVARSRVLSRWQSLGTVLVGTALGSGATYYILQNWTYYKHPLDIPVVKLSALQDPKRALETPCLTEEQIDEKLRANEVTHTMSELGVSRYDRVALRSNSVIEDAHSEAVIEAPDGSRWGFWGIYDGHM
jgi:hypothetical protein